VTAPTGTVTFLFTDIEGSTRLWQRGEEQMRAALARHDELLRSAVAEHGGTMFSSMGDGFAAAFPSAPAAVRAALAAQQFVQGEAGPAAAPLRVRMGLHTGEAELRDGDYFGTTVNRTAHSASASGGLPEAEARPRARERFVFDRCRCRLKAEGWPATRMSA
jgi:class 3 adenylate cyclase